MRCPSDFGFRRVYCHNFWKPARGVIAKFTNYFSPRARAVFLFYSGGKRGVFVIVIVIDIDIGFERVSKGFRNGFERVPEGFRKGFRKLAFSPLNFYIIEIEDFSKLLIETQIRRDFVESFGRAFFLIGV